MKLNTIFNLVEASVGADLKVSHTARTMKAAADIVYDDCYDALWMFRENKPLWRGNKTPLVDPNTVGVLDPSATERVSQNTSNQYTLFFDNHPERANWPKRSRSLICTTSRRKVSDYTGGLPPYVIIPFDHTKIGAINSDDMWDTDLVAVPPPGNWHGVTYKHGVRNLNFAWDTLYPNLHTWADWVRADGDKALNDAAIAFAKEKDPRADDAIGNVGLLIQKHGLLATINMMYSNKNLTPAHSVHKTSNLQGVSGEVWVGGKCLVIPSGYWDKFRAEIVSGIHE